MITRSIFTLVTVCSLPLLVLAVGCAAPTSGNEGETTQDLGSSATPSVSTGGARVIDPLCREHELRSDACIEDSAWREHAEELCHSEHMKVESFRVITPCGGPTPTPVPGPSPTPASGGPSAAGGGGGSSSGGPSTGGGGSTTGGGGIPAATAVQVACCNYGVEPLVRPESARVVAH